MHYEVFKDELKYSKNDLDEATSSLKFHGEVLPGACALQF